MGGRASRIWTTAAGGIQFFVQRDAIGEDAYERSRAGIWATSSASRAASSRPRPASCRSKAANLRLLVKCAAAAAGEIPRSDGPGTALSPTLPRSDHEPEVRARFSASAREILAHLARTARCARLHRSRNADDAADCRRRARASVRHPSQRARYPAVSAHRARAVSQAAASSADSSGYTRSTATSVTKACPRGTIPNSPCLKPTRPMVIAKA